MIFAHDTEQALAELVALLNTAPSDYHGEQLAAVEDLDEFVRVWEWTGSRRRDQAEIDGVHRVRARLRALWLRLGEDDGLDDAVDVINGLLRDARALPQLVRHDDWGYHLHATPPEAPLPERMAVDAALAVSEVIRAGELDRLRVCAAADCDDALVDLSKNHSRRFCSTSCLNRTNVAAYRARQAQARQLAPGGLLSDPTTSGPTTADA